MWSKYLLRLTDTPIGSAALGVVATTALGAVLTLLSTTVFGSYGYALFVATPFALGFFSAVFHGLSRTRDQADAVMVGTISVVLASLALIAFALEGAICIVMALPITIALGVVGAIAGHAVQTRVGRGRAAGQALSVVLLLPVAMGAESATSPEPPLRSVTTAVVVDAPPAVVWRNVVSVEPLPEPHELVFRLGIAYPTRATLSGRGVGAVRRCTFTTGDFVEPITAWEPSRRLEFSVRSQPAPMRELSPWSNVHPPHLDGFLRSERGRFELVPLAGGRTLLRGTSWYRNRMWPQTYWGFWADTLMHTIHGRVLRHVKALSERDRPARQARRRLTQSLLRRREFPFRRGIGSRPVSALAYDLRRTTGYIVADSRGRVIGKVESPMYGTKPDEPDALAVRNGFFGRRRHLVPADAIEQIDATSGVIGLRVPRENVRSFL